MMVKDFSNLFRDWEVSGWRPGAKARTRNTLVKYAPRINSFNLISIKSNPTRTVLVKNTSCTSYFTRDKQNSFDCKQVPQFPVLYVLSGILILGGKHFLNLQSIV
jgi:hypothetical protein